MKRLTTFYLLASISILTAEEALIERPLEDIKASIQMPEGWTFSKESEDGVFVYQFNRNTTQGEPPIMTLSVTTKVSERVGQPPSEYAAALIDMSQDEEGAASTAQKGVINDLPSLRSEYDFDGDSGKMHAVNVAIANDKTSTLYFFAWQCPIDEAADLKALREKILSSAKFDSTF